MTKPDLAALSRQKTIDYLVLSMHTAQRQALKKSVYKVLSLQKVMVLRKKMQVWIPGCEEVSTDGC